MKRIGWIAVLVLMGLWLSGCGGGNGGNPDTPKSTMAKVPTDLGFERPESLKE